MHVCYRFHGRGKVLPLLQVKSVGMSAIFGKIQVLPGGEKHGPGLKLSLQGCRLHLEKYRFLPYGEKCCPCYYVKSEGMLSICGEKRRSFYQEVKNTAWHQVKSAEMLPMFGNIWVLCWVAQLCPSWLSFMEQLMFFKGTTGISCGNNLYLSWVQFLFLEETTPIICGNTLDFSQEQLLFLMGTTLASCRNNLYFSWEQVIFLMGTLSFFTGNICW